MAPTSSCRAIPPPCSGVPKLRGAQVMATDLRASVSLVIAGLMAEGKPRSTGFTTSIAVSSGWSRSSPAAGEHRPHW